MISRFLSPWTALDALIVAAVTTALLLLRRQRGPLSVHHALAGPALAAAGLGLLGLLSLTGLAAGFLGGPDADPRALLLRFGPLATLGSVLCVAAGVHIAKERLLALASDEQHAAQRLSRALAERAEAERTQREHALLYRSFYARRREGILRLTLEQPMFVDTPVGMQLEHLERYAYVADCNEAAARMYRYPGTRDLTGLRLQEVLRGGGALTPELLGAFVESGHRLSDAAAYDRDDEGNVRRFAIDVAGVIDGDRLTGAWVVQRSAAAAEQAARSSPAEQDAERRRIASRLDEEVGQALEAVMLNLQTIGELAADERIGRHAADGEIIVNQAMHQVRSLVHELRLPLAS
jgi:signal transduction histidine kinase